MGVTISINVPLGTTQYETKSAYASAYGQALINEVESYREDDNKLSVDAIYFVNGDATLLPIDKLVKLLDTIKEVFEVKKTTEIRLQGSHTIIDKDYLDVAMKHGINSIYMDIKTVGERACKLTKTKYVAKGFEKNYKLLNEYEKLKKTYNCQLDIIGYSVTNWTKDFDKFLKAEPDVIEFLEGETETTQGAQEYQFANDLLTAKGYEHTGFRWYKPAYKKKKKVDETIGLGINMISLLDGMKTRNTSDFSTYLKYSEYPEKIIVDIQKA